MGIYYIPGIHIYWAHTVYFVLIRNHMMMKIMKTMKIIFLSESMASLLGYMPTSLHNTTLYEIVADNDKVFASSSS